MTEFSLKLQAHTLCFDVYSNCVTQALKTNKKILKLYVQHLNNLLTCSSPSTDSQGTTLSVIWTE